MGLGRAITEDWVEQTKKEKESDGKPYRVDDGEAEDETEKATLPGDEAKDKKADQELKKKVEGKLYHFYLDDPFEVTGMHQRWMTGALVSDAEKAEFCDPLMMMNTSIERLAHKNRHIALEETKAREAFEQTSYELVDLPSVDSLVLQFPFTNGFISALIFSYKVRDL
jgi:cobalamin biosynthesis protein CobT